MEYKELFRFFKNDVTDEDISKLEHYYKKLVEYNEKVNLTAITEHEEVFIKHFYDSLLVSKVIDLNNIENLCDVGAGAGFPSIPLKILFPHLKVTIVDSLEKRLVFLRELADELSLDNITLVHKRAEEYVDGRETFDLVTARAVARQNIVNELCLPLAKIGGYFISMKGSNYEEEINEGNSLKLLNSEIASINQFDLPNDYGKRVLISIKHLGKINNKYPRQFAKIKKNPL